MKGQLRIDQLFAFICLDDDGTEGIPAFLAEPGLFGPYPTMIPLMGADLARVNALRAIVLEEPRLKGKRVTLARFDVRTDVEVLTP